MKNHRGIVAIILALCIGLALLITVISWGYTDRVPDPVITAEVLALIAAALGAISVYLGMSAVSESKDSEESDEDIMREWGEGLDDESDPEVDAEGDEFVVPEEDRG